MASGSEDYWMTQSNWLSALINAIKLSVTTGGDLITKLDNLDGKADGRLDLSAINTSQASIIAELLDIDADLITGGDLITKLDALDGTMDGKLTLSELNTSSVKTNLDTTITRLNTTITRLDTTITKLTDIVTHTLATSKSGYMIFTGSVVTIINDPGTMQVTATFWTHPDNTANVVIRFYDNGSMDHSEGLAPGERYADVGLLGHVTAYASSGTQLMGFVVS